MGISNDFIEGLVYVLVLAVGVTIGIIYFGQRAECIESGGYPVDTRFEGIMCLDSEVINENK